MSDPTTTNLVLAVPAHLSDSGTWDTPINGDMTIIDACFGSVTSKSLASSDITLTATEAQASILRFSGALGANVIVTLPSIFKSWVAENNCTGAFTVRLRGSTGEVVGLPPGSCQVYWDGANVKFANLDKIGAYWDYVGTSVPAWVNICTTPPYLACIGSTFNGTTYPLLAAVLGGTTLPDFRGRNRSYLDESVGRITTAGCGIDGSTILSAGGTQNKAILLANFPSLNFNSDVGTGAVAIPNFESIAVVTEVTGTNTKVTILQGTGTTSSQPLVTNSTTVPTGGSGTALVTIAPTCMGGITMIRAG